MMVVMMILVLASIHQSCNAADADDDQYGHTPYIHERSFGNENSIVNTVPDGS